MKYLLILTALIFSLSNCTQKNNYNNLPKTDKEINSSKDDINFIVVADRTGSHRPGVFTSAASKINELQADFVISVGDLIEGYTTNKTVVEKQWQKFDETVNSLDMPFFYVAGNHDFTNKEMKEIWNNKYDGKEYYHFLHKNTLFLCLNTESDIHNGNSGYIDSTQFEFAKEVLKNNSDVRHTFVFMHKPLWRGHYKGGKWEDIEKLLSSRKHTVFAGHEHSYVKTDRNKGEYFTLATTGGASGMNGKSMGEFDHLTMVNVKSEKISIVNLELDGIVDKNIVTQTKKEIIEEATDNPPFIIQTVFANDIDRFTSAKSKIKLKNSTDYKIKFLLNETNSKNMSAFVFDREIILDAKSEKETEIKISKLKDGDAKSVKLNITARYFFEEDSVDVNFSYNIKPLEKRVLKQKSFDIQIDGNEDEWGEFEYSWQTEDKNSKAFYSIYRDENYIYFGIKVIDDSVVSYGEGAAFKQDNVGFGFSPSPLEISSMSRGKHWYKYEFWQLITPENDSVESVYYRKMPEGSKSICIQKDYGYFAEAAIPVSIIKEKQGEDWQSIRVNLAIDDNDGDGEVNRYWWQPNWMDSKINIIGSGTFFKN